MSAPYPFAAVVGQEEAKLALLLHAVHRGLGGVLLAGGSGTAKSVLLRGVACLLEGEKSVEVPLGVTEDRLLGSVDLERIARTGRKRLQAGLLAAAHGGCLVADHINLLPAAFTGAIMEAAKTGRLQLEREGLSIRQPAAFRLFASLQPEEGELSAAALDQFGLCVYVRGETGMAERKEIMRRQLAYESDPAAFARLYAAETDSLRKRIALARLLLPAVEAGESCFRLAIQWAEQAGCHGQRGELYLVEAARALAAWEGRDYCTEQDMGRAAAWVLLHRQGDGLKERREQQHTGNREEHGETEQEELPGEEGQTGEEPGEPPNREESRALQESAGEEKDQRLPPSKPLGENPAAGDHSVPPEERGTDSRTQDGDSKEQLTVETVGQLFVPPPLSFEPKDRLLRRGAGRRNLSRSGTSQGRYVAFAMPKGKVTDLALDATLRAAAPYQGLRQRRGLAVAIEPEDMRQKVRERRTGTAILFVVDASGSMAARKRMEAVKGAILSLLQDAYQKRDRIGMVAFRGDLAETILPFTRSVELAAKELGCLPTGGRTPLAKGMMHGWRMMDRARRQDRELIPVMVLVTDGRANQGMDTAGGMKSIIEETFSIARSYRQSGMRALVIDTEQGYVKLEQAALLAEAMGADYCRLEELSGGQMAAAVRRLTGSAQAGSMER